MNEPRRVIVEVISHADVERLERRDDDLRELITAQDRKIEGLHRQLYELMEALRKLRNT